MATRADAAKPVLKLVLLAAVLTAIVALVASVTHERIQHNEQAWISQRLDALVAPATHDNDLLTDSIAVIAPDLLGSSQPVRIYRARRAGAPVAAVIRAIAPDGYRGPIELLVAIGQDSRLIGVQVIRHDETPGLGDAFESRDVHWLDHFRGRSLTDPPPPRWTVRRDGGDFDAFTGATITPRAIVKAVRNALDYYQRNSKQIFDLPSQ
ncbi:MAG TPA: electron transport complex subunit RsxG [Steroidobacteraceae bacterium]|nr:electron transport complex subunit RsxG [Steroidobacteraceae bacterium]